MEKLYKKFGDRIQFIGVNLGIEKDLGEFIEKYHLTFPISYDRKKSLASLFKAGIETNILIDKKGTITLKEKGVPDDLEQYLRKLIQDNPGVK